MKASLTVKGDDTLRAAMTAARLVFGSREPLLRQLGTHVLGEIGKNFAAEGRPRWAPMAESTRLARRAGSGKKSGGGGAKLLQDTGAYRRSFDMRSDSRRVVVFSTSPIAVFHEYGTGTHAGKAKYPIVPKNAKALALPFLPGRDNPKASAGRGKVGRVSLAGLKRATRGADGRLTATEGPRAGKTVAPLTRMAFYMKVMHPGVAARPVLPNPDTIVSELTGVALVFMARSLRRAGVALR